MSLTRLCLIEGKAPFGQLKACATENPSPHGQCKGNLSGVQPYLKQSVSLKACLFSCKPYYVIWMTVSHVDVPLSLACSTAFCWPFVSDALTTSASSAAFSQFLDCTFAFISGFWGDFGGLRGRQPCPTQTITDGVAALLLYCESITFSLKAAANVLFLFTVAAAVPSTSHCVFAFMLSSQCLWQLWMLFIVMFIWGWLWWFCCTFCWGQRQFKASH